MPLNFPSVRKLLNAFLSLKLVRHHPMIYSSWKAEDSETQTVDAWEQSGSMQLLLG